MNAEDSRGDPPSTLLGDQAAQNLFFLLWIGHAVLMFRWDRQGEDVTKDRVPTHFRWESE